MESGCCASFNIGIGRTQLVLTFTTAESVYEQPPADAFEQRRKQWCRKEDLKPLLIPMEERVQSVRAPVDRGGSEPFVDAFEQRETQWCRKEDAKPIVGTNFRVHSVHLIEEVLGSEALSLIFQMFRSQLGHRPGQPIVQE